MFLQWLEKIVEIWCNEQNVPRSSLCLAANLTGFLIKSEKFFRKMHSTRLLGKFIAIIRAIHEPVQLTQIKISYINLISSCLQHDSGLYWLMETSYWFDIITMASQDGQQQIGKESISFLLKFFEQSNSRNASFCKTVIDTIITPLRDVALSSSMDKDVSMFETPAMKETLYLLQSMFMASLEHSCITKDFTILSLCLDNFRIEKDLNDIITLVENKESLITLISLLFVVVFCSMARNWVVENFSPLKALKTTDKLNELVGKVLLTCKPYDSLLTIIQNSIWIGTYHFNMYERQISKNNKTGGSFAETLQNQFVMYLLWPIIRVVSKKTEFNEGDEFRQDFAVEFTRNILPVLAKVILRYAGSITFSTEVDAVRALKHIQICSSLLCDSAANMLTQFLIYFFSDIISKPENLQGKNGLSQDYIGLYIDTLVVLLKTFDLTLNNKVGTVHVTDIAFYFLNQSFWTPKVSFFLLHFLLSTF